jgi:uncharacterized membrane protein
VSESTHTSETNRLEAFSDGVFSIAITLLILEVKLPAAAVSQAAGGLWPALVAQWPSFASYVISFVTIGIMWINHHTMFQYIRRTDRNMLLLHILFLLLVSFVPYPTSLVATYVMTADGRTAALLYGATFTAIALAYNAIWWYGVRDVSLLGRDVHQAGLRTISKRYRVGPLMYFAATVVAFVNVPASLAAYTLLALFFALPDRRRQRAVVAAILCVAAAKAGAQQKPDEWHPLFDGKSLAGWRETPFTGRGAVRVEKGTIVLDAGKPMTGLTWTGAFPKSNYEVRFEAQRVAGNDFFASLTFPVGDSFATWVTGGWGGDIVGISSIDGWDASENETRQYFNFENGRWYAMRLRVTDARVEAWIDGQQIVNVSIEGRTVGLRYGEIKLSAPLGFASYLTTGTLRKTEYRSPV